MSYYKIMVGIINANLKTVDQILNKYGFFREEPLKSYKARLQVSDSGVKYWLSATRNAETREIIMNSIINQ